MHKLSDHLSNNKEKYKEYSAYIDQLHEKIQNSIIMENSDNGVYTSYSLNKGEQIVFCLRSRKTKDQFHDLNLVMYVVLHEMSHVACPEYGHGDLFKYIFAFMTQNAIELNLYNKIDFSNNPTEYCGMIINASII